MSASPKKNFVFIILFLLAIFLGINPLLEGSTEAADVVKLIAGETKIIPTQAPSRVVIGNPSVADIGEVTNSEITVNAKSAGTTTLVFWDALGEQSFNIRVLSENMEEIKRRMDNLLKELGLPDVYTQIAEEEGRVLLLGKVKTAQDKERINSALETLKTKVTDLLLVKEEEAIIEIDVQVLELNKDATDILGLTNPLSTSSGITITEIGTPGISAVGTKWSTLFKVQNLFRGSTSAGASTTNPFSWTLYALIQEGKARVLSRPRLACQSGKEAELLVGGEKPILTTSVAATTGAAGTSVEYKEYGIKLKIKPTVSDEKRIKLGLNVEIVDVASTTPESIGTSATSTTAKAYPFNKRTIATEVFLNTGQTLAIGGLIKQKTEEDVVRTPFLSDIPFIGAAFRKKQTKVGGGQGERGNVELFVTLTPTILTNKAKAETPQSLTAASQLTLAAPKKESPEALESFVKNMEYSSAVQRRILENLSYPPPAREAGYQGTVRLRLRLSYLGELLGIEVKDSSGYKILDDNAFSAAQNISSYPPFPASIEQKELWVEVPIIYKLN